MLPYFTERNVAAGFFLREVGLDLFHSPLTAILFSLLDMQFIGNTSRQCMALRPNQLQTQTKSWELGT